MVIKWEEPPVNPMRKHDHEGIATALMSRPGQWALVFEDMHASVARNIRVGTYKAYLPAGSFESKVVGVDQESGRARKIFARYVGEVSE